MEEDFDFPDDFVGANESSQPMTALLDFDFDTLGGSLGASLNFLKKVPQIPVTVVLNPNMKSVIELFNSECVKNERTPLQWWSRLPSSIIKIAYESIITLSTEQGYINSSRLCINNPEKPLVEVSASPLVCVGWISSITIPCQFTHWLKDTHTPPPDCLLHVSLRLDLDIEVLRYTLSQKVSEFNVSNEQNETNAIRLKPLTSGLGGIMGQGLLSHVNLTERPPIESLSLLAKSYQSYHKQHSRSVNSGSDVGVTTMNSNTNANMNTQSSTSNNTSTAHTQCTCSRSCVCDIITALSILSSHWITQGDDRFSMILHVSGLLQQTCPSAYSVVVHTWYLPDTDDTNDQLAGVAHVNVVDDDEIELSEGVSCLQAFAAASGAMERRLEELENNKKENDLDSETVGKLSAAGWNPDVEETSWVDWVKQAFTM